MLFLTLVVFVFVMFYFHNRDMSDLIGRAKEEAKRSGSTKSYIDIILSSGDPLVRMMFRVLDYIDVLIMYYFLSNCIV